MGNIKYTKIVATEDYTLVEDPNLFDYSISPALNVDLNYSTKSPLRYPGGKTRGVDFISRFIPKNLDKLLSPFIGGGSVELNIAAKGTKVIGYDVFNPLVEFWQSVLNNPIELTKEVQKFYPLSRELFYKLQNTQNDHAEKIKRAAIYFVLNRASFSGSTLSGGMSPEHPRFTLNSIERLAGFFNPNLDVNLLDFRESLTKHPYAFAYLDPPYMVKSSLYGRKGDAHKSFDHIALFNLLKDRLNWLLSYNDCDEIRQLYEGFHIVTPNWKYGMSNDKNSKEVLIFSKNFQISGFYYL